MKSEFLREGDFVTSLVILDPENKSLSVFQWQA
jgi:hypothetical protein